MDDTPHQAVEPGSLRLLRILVTVLLGVMIAGFILLIVLFVTRFPGGPAAPALPGEIVLPEDATARAVTFGPDWLAVVTTDDRILILDRATGTLRQSVTIRTTP